METTVQTVEGVPVAVVRSEDPLIVDVQTALDLMATVRYETDCDRMMVFDGWNDPVTRCMRRIATDAPPEDLAEMAHADGIIYNNLLFNEVDSHFTYAHEHKGAPEYAFWNEDVAHENLPPLSFEIMQHEVFNHENGRFRDRWYASLYDDYLVFYSPYDPERRQPPVKAWKRYKQVWPKEDEAG